MNDHTSMTYQLGSSFDNLQNTVNNSMGDGVGRLHADQELCDVTVTVGDESFLCHKVVLASVSRFFQALFRNEPTSDHVPIDNDYVSANAFGVFVDMLYKKLDGVTDANTANDVLIAAMFLQVQFLQEHCERFLVNDMTPDTCLDMWQFADSYELKILEEGARAMAMSQFNEDAFSNAFGSLPLHFLLILLSSNNLVVNEDNVCERIVYWVRKNAQAREQYLPQLLPFVNFLNVSDSYRETLRQQALQFSSIESYLSEALTFKLETATKINSVTRREILARQDKRVTSAEVDMHVVAIGGVGTDGRSTRTVRIVETDNKTEDKPRQLEMLDVDPGIGFATCVWRNELYISGGSKKPEMFKVYNSGADAWKSLPNLLQRRKGHAIVAVGWNIYILGGEEAATVSSCLEETDEEDEGVPEEQKEKEESVPTKESEAAVEITAPSLLSDISMYSTRTRTWSKFGQLTEPRTDVSAAVLGHRIYVFGGKNADNQPTSLVECVDTLTGSVYLAGRLPSPTSGARALSDGGSVFVTLPEVGVYQMKEHHHFTDSEKMQEATTQDTTPLPAFGEKDVVHKDSAVFKSEDRRRMSEAFQKSRHAIPEEKQQEADACNDADSIAQLLGPAKAPEAEVKNEDANAEEKSLLVQSDTNHSMALRKGDQRGNGADHQPTVTFHKLAVLPERRHFGACIYKGNVLVGGGLDQNGERLSDFKFFGSVTMASTLALEGGLSHFGLHVLEVPKLTDKATFRFTFRPDKLDGKNSLESHRVKINRFTWFLRVTENSGYLSVFLHREQIARTIKGEVSRLVAKHRQTGNVQNPSRSGRPRVTTAREDRLIVHHARTNRFKPARHITNDLQHVIRRVSRQTINNRLLAADLPSRRPRKKPELTPQHRQARLQYARVHVHWNIRRLRRLMWTDEKRFCLYSNDDRVRVRRSRGQAFNDDCVRQIPARARQSVLVWAGFTYDHKIALEVIDGNTVQSQVQ